MYGHQGVFSPWDHLDRELTVCAIVSLQSFGHTDA